MSAHPAVPTEITVTTRAKDGLAPIKWLAQIWVVAGRIEIDIFKNGHEWGQSVTSSEVFAALSCAGSHKSHRYVANKIKGLAAFVAAREGIAA